MHLLIEEGWGNQEAILIPGVMDGKAALVCEI